MPSFGASSSYTIQRRLDSVTRRLEDARAAVASGRDDVERLRAARDRDRGAATSAEDALLVQVRETYKRGSGHIALRLLDADDLSDILEQTRLLAWVTDERHEQAEAAAALQAQREQADTLLERALTRSGR